MTTGIIVQARTGSTRLPGKVLARVMGRPLLAWQIERLQRSRLADRIVIATTRSPADYEIARLAITMGCDFFLGSEDDVLSRYIGAARMVGADVVIRSTADCPVIDPAYLDLLIAQFGDAEYGWLGDHPGGIPNGMGAEAIRLSTLEAIYPHTTADEREHVTLYVRRRPTEFRMMHVETGLGLDDERWTVDTAEDLELIRRIIEALHPLPFTLGDIKRLLAANPGWRAINAGVPLGLIEREHMSRYARDFQPLRGDL